MSDKNYSPSNESQVNAELKKAEALRKIEVADMKRLLDQQWGRRIVWRLLCRAGVYETSYDFAGPRDAPIFKEGRREMGLFILAELHEANPKSYQLMVEENKPE